MSWGVAGLVQSLRTVPSHGSTVLPGLGHYSWVHRAGEEGGTVLGEQREKGGLAKGHTVNAKHPLPEGSPMPKSHRGGACCGIFSVLVWLLQVQLRKAEQADGRTAVTGMVLLKTPPHPGLVRGGDLQPGVFPSTFSVLQPFLFHTAWEVCHTAGDATSQLLHWRERGCQTLWTFISPWLKNRTFALLLPGIICIRWMFSEISHPLFTRQDYFGVQKVFQTPGRTSVSTVWKPHTKLCLFI